MKKYEVEYSSNNSGGRWWLDDQDWYDLEKDGWTVNWAKDRKNGEWCKPDKDDRWLGALAYNATKKFAARDKYAAEGLAIADWQNITGKYERETGCPCCGVPHSFWATEVELYIFLPENYPSCIFTRL